MKQIQDIKGHEKVTSKDLNLKNLEKTLSKYDLEELQSLPKYDLNALQSLPASIEYKNEVSADISRDEFKSILTQVIKDKYSC